MIRSFRHKGLRDLFAEDDPAGVRPDLAARCRRILAALHVASRPEDLNIPGWRLHPLHGKPKRWAVAVNGPWRVTFEWEDGDALRVDLEQYH
ncbi:type II toxin-antitoxin system RelE/ParE family toxin [Roseicella aquatilis]|uniref:Plasmid maintenance system killer n=1 Tax=Roseicella aquatilis TaxID=2527868 RepID=A0A4R4DJ33_9PROT|nr:type II toxin-antitoxin system RelE/ParE family toxin [Roseicella aquatilis]TCZ61266.1 plasmid maintenance system killer [Roseicella aquatilis]